MWNIIWNVRGKYGKFIVLQGQKLPDCAILKTQKTALRLIFSHSAVFSLVCPIPTNNPAILARLSNAIDLP